MTSATASSVPKGARLNNPLNLRRTSIKWQGKAPVQNDPDFETFVDPHHGIRAAARNLLTYYRRDKLRTIQGIVSKWAPPEDDNDTGAYISFVAQKMSVSADEELNLEDPDILSALVVAMMTMEIGSVPYSAETVSTAVRAAYSGALPNQPVPTYVPSVYEPPPAPKPTAPVVTTAGEKIVPPLVDQPSPEPTRKVTAGTIGAMGGFPVAFIAKVFWDKYLPNDPMPTEIAIAIAAGFSSLCSFVAAYFTRNRATAPIQE